MRVAENRGTVNQKTTSQWINVSDAAFEMLQKQFDANTNPRKVFRLYVAGYG